MKAVKLKTEYLKNPLGIDIKNPRFMWNCAGGKAQSAYRIVASDTRGNILWDSGKVESSQMSFIPYPLDTPSRLRVNWKTGLRASGASRHSSRSGSETPRIGARSG